MKKHHYMEELATDICTMKQDMQSIQQLFHSLQQDMQYVCQIDRRMNNIYRLPSIVNFLTHLNVSYAKIPPSTLLLSLVDAVSQ